MILAQLAKLTHHSMNQLLLIVGIALTHHFFFKSGAIWNILAKFQPNQFRNDDFSTFDQIVQPPDQPTTSYGLNSLNSPIFQIGGHLEPPRQLSAKSVQK